MGDGTAAEGTDRGGVPGGGGTAVPGAHAAVVRAQDVAAAAAVCREWLLLLAIAAPWHVLATLRNPPYFDFTMHSESGSYHGFFWFYFINEHVLRFLNLRYPRDYNTVPRLYFWLFHLLWFFPWSVYLPGGVEAELPQAGPGVAHAAAGACAGPDSSWCSSPSRRRRNTTRCRAIRRWRCCWARAMASGHRMAAVGHAGGGGGRDAGAALAIAAILWTVRGLPAPGDIAAALTQNPDVYTLSLGHMTDLTLAAFAYLRLPLAVAGVAFAGRARSARGDGRAVPAFSW